MASQRSIFPILWVAAWNTRRYHIFGLQIPALNTAVDLSNRAYIHVKRGGQSRVNYMYIHVHLLPQYVQALEFLRSLLILGVPHLLIHLSNRDRRDLNPWRPQITWLSNLVHCTKHWWRHRGIWPNTYMYLVDLGLNAENPMESESDPEDTFPDELLCGNKNPLGDRNIWKPCILLCQVFPVIWIWIYADTLWREPVASLSQTKIDVSVTESCFILCFSKSTPPDRDLREKSIIPQGLPPDFLQCLVRFSHLRIVLYCFRWFISSIVISHTRRSWWKGGQFITLIGNPLSWLVMNSSESIIITVQWDERNTYTW